jgi:hypothetical protein
MGGEPGTQRFVERIVGCQAPVPLTLIGSESRMHRVVDLFPDFDF